jgi:hypothetical protein
MSSNPSSSLVRSLVGSDLASVVFVRDYVQLVFEPATVGAPEPGTLVPPTTGVIGTLSAYTLPAITDDSRSFHSGEPGYADALVEQIGRRVVEADEVEDSLRVRFEGGVIFTISLVEDDLRVPESAMLQLHDDSKSWMVWRPSDRL